VRLLIVFGECRYEATVCIPDHYAK
jgi:hypothetical protein